jgi:hypothetical protein
MGKKKNLHPKSRVNLLKDSQNRAAGAISPEFTNTSSSPPNLNGFNVNSIKPWKPMAHSCAVCDTKTSAGRKFIQSCLNTHEVVCLGFHNTLLRKGCEDKCHPCKNQAESEEKWQKSLETQKKEIEWGKKENLSKKQMKELNDNFDKLEREYEDWLKATHEKTWERQAGYYMWLAGCK